MLVKDGVAYLQAGGGIVFDSDPYDEWMETINKLGKFILSSFLSLPNSKRHPGHAISPCSLGVWKR